MKKKYPSLPGTRLWKAARRREEKAFETYFGTSFGMFYGHHMGGIR